MAREYPIIDEPIGLNKIVKAYQDAILRELSWMDDAFGIAEKRMIEHNGRSVLCPCVYCGAENSSNEYLSLVPDSHIGNYSFFLAREPEKVEWEQFGQGRIKTPFSAIFWLDLTKVFNDSRKRDTERIKWQIADVLKQVHVSGAKMTIEYVYTDASQVFREFRVASDDDLMFSHPYFALRFDGMIDYREECREVIW